MRCFACGFMSKNQEDWLEIDIIGIKSDDYTKVRSYHMNAENRYQDRNLFACPECGILLVPTENNNWNTSR